MGTGFTIDTPLNVSHLGINSVISLVDDILLEKLRKMYSEQFQLPYQEITKTDDDFRAKRITSYLNLINDLAKEKFEELKSVTAEKSDEIASYIAMLPDVSDIKRRFEIFKTSDYTPGDFTEWLREHLKMGSIDVNIMTKLDKANYLKGERLPQQFNDAHAAVRGFAQSDLSSSLILSAGMSPRLYGYLEEFDDFYPDAAGQIKKKVVLKVSDYRSAFIQGKFLAKKGIWVTEYRIESGLNCGGHAFATQGLLLGPILAEFKNHRQDLIDSVHAILVGALEAKGRPVPSSPLPMLITAQGGVGTAEEHTFLLEEYGMDSVGWGSPFLLVDEVTTVDEFTRSQLSAATEKDLYLSNISPLGVPFNSLRGNTQDVVKQALIDKGKPGSSCPKKFLVSNTEYTDQHICTASRQYQHLKLQELEAAGLSEEELNERRDKVVDKSCLCIGLGTTALLTNDLNTKIEGTGVSVCPGPNIAYFSDRPSLRNMVDHIYGRVNIMHRPDRPNMFVKELFLYLDYLKDQIQESSEDLNRKQQKFFTAFTENLDEGIRYYQDVFKEMKHTFLDSKDRVLKDLVVGREQLDLLAKEIETRVAEEAELA